MSRIPQIPSDIMYLLDSAVREDDAAVRLDIVLSAMLAGTEYEWAWTDAVREP